MHHRSLPKSSIASIACIAALAATIVALPNNASASHVGAVELTPAVGISALDVCSPVLVTARNGSEPIGAVVDVEVAGDVPVRFCLPDTGLNPVLVGASTGDLGSGPVEIDGNIGGEAMTQAGTVAGEGSFTLGVSSTFAGSLDIVAFVEEPGADNDDPESGEPADFVSTFFVMGGGTGDGIEVPGATQLVTALDCVPEQDVNPSGGRHDFLCRATGLAGLAVAGAEVSFDILSGPNNEEIGHTACGFSDANGVVTCSYVDAVGPESPVGTDTIVVFTGPSLDTSVNQDTIESVFAGSDGEDATKVASTVGIRGRFKGGVRSAVPQCKSERKVLVRKVRPGRDPVRGRDRTNRWGAYRVGAKRASGRYYAVVKRKRFDLGGSPIVCKADRSRRVRR